MKSIVIYDSNFGNTKLIADIVAHTLQCAAMHVSEVTKETLNGVEVILVGSPINAWRPTQPIQKFLASLGDLKNIKAAAFDTRIKVFFSGNAAKKITMLLEQKGAIMLSAPKAFYVKDKEGPLAEGETENAAIWADQLLKKIVDGKTKL